MGSREKIGRESQGSADAEAVLAAPLPAQADALAPLLQQRMTRLGASALPEVVIGELIALADEGQTPLVRFPGQAGSAALRARSVIGLHGVHIGSSVVLSFEAGDETLPIVMGVLQRVGIKPVDAAEHVEVDVDGDRMVVSAKKQFVMRCGKASITLTSAGKVLIEGSYVMSRATGLNRIKGGSIDLN